jgi:hypothetical protein
MPILLWPKINEMIEFENSKRSKPTKTLRAIHWLDFD